jgi:NodT family efflux transporter outer membrane factor (OMF) lipoprotein
MVGPDYHPPSTDTPAEWGEVSSPDEAARQGSAQVAMWWTVFNDPELTSLLEWAAENNLDLQQATARIQQARALRTITASSLWPTVVAQGSYARERGSANAPSFEPGDQFNLYQVGFDASWELDVFGGNRRAVQAAEAELQAAELQRDAVLVSLLGEVGSDYIAYRSLQQRIGIANENVKTQQDTLALTQRLFNAGLATDLDVARAEAQVATTAAQIPQLTTEAQQAMHGLGVLLGEPPMTLADELSYATPIPHGPAVVDVGIPSDVLLQRPDLRTAERGAAAATAEIGVAMRDLYPRFYITGLGALQSLRASDLFDWHSRAMSIGPSITWTVFDAGLTRATVRLRTAQQQAQVAAYRSVVLQAFAEVEDALVGYAQAQVRRDSLVTAVNANQRAADRSLQLYTQGLTDFLSVLEAQLNLFTSQDQLALSQRDIALELVALYKALGGGWDVAAGPPPPPALDAPPAAADVTG